MSHGLERLAELVRLYREARLLSQETLARSVRPRTNRSAVAHLEQALRLPPASVLRGICTYLGIPEAAWLPYESGIATPASSSAPSLIAVAGIMGSGKTTLAKRLASHLGLTYVSESSLGVRFLSDLAMDRSRWAFDTQLAFLTQKAMAIQAALDRGARVIVDRSLHEDVEVFARHFFESGDIDGRSFEVYSKLAAYFLERIPAPDLLLFCECTPATAHSRIAVRDRSDTRLHTPEHVTAIAELYRRWIGAYTSSTALQLDSEAHDFRDQRVVQAIGAELERVYTDTPIDVPQLELFSNKPRQSGGTPRLEFVRVLFRGPRVDPRRSAGAVTPLPYPSAYVAAPFSGIARPPRGLRRTLFPIGQPEGRIERGPYRSALVDIARTLEGLGIRALLPHRDLNRWGAKSLTSEEVMRACTASVAATDVFVGILGASHGAHYEYGLARGLGKPAILFPCAELSDSFVASGIASGHDVLVLPCARLRDAAKLLTSESAREFLRAHLVGLA